MVDFISFDKLFPEHVYPPLSKEEMAQIKLVFDNIIIPRAMERLYAEWARILAKQARADAQDYLAFCNEQELNKAR